MKLKKIVLLSAVIGSVFLISSCGEQNKDNGQNENSTIQSNTITSQPTDQTESSPEQSDASEQSSTPEQSDAPEKSSAPEQSAAQQTPDSGQSSSQPPESKQPAENNAAPTLTKITKTFDLGNGSTSEIEFQMPDSWSYTSYDPEVDWGFNILVENKEDGRIRLFGQYGTLTSISQETSESISTTSGLTGKLYPDKHTGDDGSSYVNYEIIFDTESEDFISSYGISVNMPESVYEDNKDAIEQFYKSISVKDTFSE